MAEGTQREFYDVESLLHATREFERSYGLSSTALYDAYVAGRVPAGVRRFDAHVWASMVEDIRRLVGESAAGQGDQGAGGTIERVRHAFAHA